MFETPFSIDFNDECTLLCTSGIKTIKDEWQSYSCSNVFLQYHYLLAIEKGIHQNLSFYYILIKRQQNVIGICYFQKINLDGRFVKQNKISRLYNNVLTRGILDKIGGGMLVCGNFFAAGENGFDFKEHININQIIDTFTSQLNKEYLQNIKAVLFKEFKQDEQEEIQKDLKHHHYTSFEIDVNMHQQLPSHWKNYEDYLAQMRTKYRSRAKSALRKTSRLTVKNLSLQEIIEQENRISELHDKVVKSSGFYLAQLTSENFKILKEQLKDIFVFTGYFFHDKLVGFNVAHLNHQEKVMDANCVGIDYHLNEKMPIYQRILYDYVRLGIDHNISQIKFGRTAELIKSSVGAQPQSLFLYIKHQNSFFNLIIRYFVKRIKPSPYEVRRPFKKG